MLEEARKELETRKAKESKLRQRLQEKEAERIDMEERYSTLQDEVQGKTRKLRKVWTMLHGSKSEVDDMRQEHQRLMEQLLEGVRQLNKELKLATLIVDEYIPTQYQVPTLKQAYLFCFLVDFPILFFILVQEIIEQHVNWSEEYGEWQLRGVAYAGNNINQYSSPRRSARSTYVISGYSYCAMLNFNSTIVKISNLFFRSQRPEMDLSYVYLSYDDVVGLSDPVRPKSAKSRTKSAASARSKAAIRAPSAQRYII
jgi:kinesin family protein 3/17